MYIKLEDNKNSVIRCRIDRGTHEEFKIICKKKALNPSELLRQWIIKFIDNNKNR